MFRFVALKQIRVGLYKPKAIISASNQSENRVVSSGCKIIPIPENLGGNELFKLFYFNNQWVTEDYVRKNFRDTVASVNFIAPLRDCSGYAEAGRNYLAALDKVGIQVRGESVSFEPARAECGVAEEALSACINKDISYSTNIVFLTPDHFPIYKRPGSYNIGIFDWETDVLPAEWVPCCNTMDEIWVPCQWTASVCKSSGVVKPINVFGHCAPLEDFENVEEFRIPGVKDSWYKFYSVFQWTERKNPVGLIEAYLKAFSSSDPVVLILKTYRCNYSDSEKKAVFQEIEKIKRSVKRKKLPRIVLVLDLLTRKQLLGLHKYADCFALIHRAEGWGLPHFEACMLGKPVITTGQSGNMEFTTEENSYLVDGPMIQVEGMPWIPWYRSHMKWWDPSTEQCKNYFRLVFNNREDAIKRAKLAQELVRKKFCLEAVGNAMKARILEVSGRGLEL